MTTELQKIAISDVVVGERYRRDPGDLDVLADSIREAGLLHPIVVTSDGLLVCGERRLRACRDLLGWKEVPARIVDDCSVEQGQYNENEIRDDLKPSEMVALVDKLRTQQGPGQPRKFDTSLRQKNCAQKSLVANTVSAEDAAESKETSRRNYYHAKKVVRDGVPELVAAMDAGEILIRAAEVIAWQPAERQREIVALPARARRERGTAAQPGADARQEPRAQLGRP